MQRGRRISIAKTIIAGGAAVLLLVVFLALVARYRALNQPLDQGEPAPLSNGAAEPEEHQGFIFGRVTDHDGATYEGRLRFGGDETFWGDYFNGTKEKNPWAAHAPPAQLKEREAIEIFGLELFHRERQVSLARPFMARFGDIARLTRNGRDLRVTLKSGAQFHLDAYEADDFADGLRVWDGARGVVDLDETQVRTIDFLPTGRLGSAPIRLHGTVRTPRGDFTGFIQWDREKGVGSDELEGDTANGKRSLRFDTVRSITRKADNDSRVTLLDSEEIAFSRLRDRESDDRGIYVDDRRYGRVLISWDAVERIDFRPGGNGPGYGDFPAGRPLTGSVTTRDGRRLAGRLIYDLDESEATETLDAPSQGIDYTLLFGLIASIVLPSPEEGHGARAKATLHDGEVLQLELAGDLAPGNAGMLIFPADGQKPPEYVRWTGIRQIDFDRPPAMYPPLERR